MATIHPSRTAKPLAIRTQKDRFGGCIDCSIFVAPNGISHPQPLDVAILQQDGRQCGHWYFQFLDLPEAFHSSAVASRRWRVSSVFAESIHSTYSRLWLGGKPRDPPPPLLCLPHEAPALARHLNRPA